MKATQSILVFLIEDVPLVAYLVFFVVGVAVFGLAYALLTPVGHGIGGNFAPFTDVTVLKGLYFSIVTVSSLGYGDMHPIGASKALACFEVLMGLTLMGIMIAKVTSRRLSYQVLRLFSSDAQKRLEGIAAGFDASRDELAAAMSELASAYQSTPGTESHADRRGVTSQVRDVVSSFQSRCAALRDYLSYEIQQGNYFSVAPVNAVVRVGDSVDSALLVLGQLIISLSPQARTETLDRRNREGISEAIESQRQVCRIVSQHATEPRIVGAFQRVGETCSGIPSSYFAVPEEVQPDQVLQGTDEPQQPFGMDNAHTESS